MNIVNILLEKGVDIRAINQALINASRDNEEDVVKALLEKGAEAKDITKPLFNAALNGHLNIVNILLQREEITKEDINKALKEAAFQGHENVVNALLQKCADAGAIGKALSQAAYGGHLNIVNILLRRKEITIEYTNEALENATTNGHKDVVNALLQKDVDIRAINQALLGSAFNGRVDIAKILLEKGADPFFIDENGNTALTLSQDDKMKSFIKSHQRSYAFRHSFGGCVLIPAALSLGAMLLSSEPMVHAGASVLAFGASCYFNGIKSYGAMYTSSYLASTALWCATSLVSEEYGVYCQVGAAVIAAATTIYAAYPNITTQSQEQGV